MNIQSLLSQENIIIASWLFGSIIGFFTLFKEEEKVIILGDQREEQDNIFKNISSRTIFLGLYIFMIISALLFTDITVIIKKIGPIYSMLLLSLPIAFLVGNAYKNFIYNITEYNLFYRTMGFIAFSFTSNTQWFISIAIILGILHLYFILPKKQLHYSVIVYLYITSMIFSVIIFSYVLIQDRTYVSNLHTVGWIDIMAFISLGHLFVFIASKVVILLLLFPNPQRENNYKINWHQIHAIKDKMYANYHISIQGNILEYIGLTCIIIGIILFGKYMNLHISWQLGLFRGVGKIYLYILDSLQNKQKYLFNIRKKHFNIIKSYD